jgi:hypothetical protein
VKNLLSFIYTKNYFLIKIEKYSVVGKLLKPGEEPTNYDEENSEDAELKKDN